MEKFDLVLFCLDHEPDDYLALLMLVNYMKKHPQWTPTIVFVCGGGDASKVELTKKMAEHVGLTSFTIVEGRLDYFGGKKEKVFPQDCFSAFGCTKTEPETIVPFDTDQSAMILDGFIKEAKNPLVIALKPLWEFVKCTSLGNCTLAMYGSFNLRQMYDSHEYTKQEVLDLLHKFKETILYEAFLATGPDNSMSMTTNPDLFDQFKARPELLAHMRGWNDALLIQLLQKTCNLFGEIKTEDKYMTELIKMFQHLLGMAQQPQKTDHEYINMLDCFALYNPDVLSSPEYMEMYGSNAKKMTGFMARQIKIIHSILIAHGLQMVIADFALMAILIGGPDQIHCTMERSAIRFNDQSLTEATPDPHSTIVVVRHVHRKEMFDCVTQWVKK